MGKCVAAAARGRQHGRGAAEGSETARLHRALRCCCCCCCQAHFSSRKHWRRASCCWSAGEVHGGTGGGRGREARRARAPSLLAGSSGASSGRPPARLALVRHAAGRVLAGATQHTRTSASLAATERLSVSASRLPHAITRPALHAQHSFSPACAPSALLCAAAHTRPRPAAVRASRSRALRPPEAAHAPHERAAQMELSCERLPSSCEAWPAAVWTSKGSRRLHSQTLPSDRLREHEERRVLPSGRAVSRRGAARAARDDVRLPRRRVLHTACFAAEGVSCALEMQDAKLEPCLCPPELEPHAR
jgi:hypothetical protein